MVSLEKLGYNNIFSKLKETLAFGKSFVTKEYERDAYGNYVLDETGAQIVVEETVVGYVGEIVPLKWIPADLDKITFGSKDYGIGIRYEGGGATVNPSTHKMEPYPPSATDDIWGNRRDEIQEELIFNITVYANPKINNINVNPLSQLNEFGKVASLLDLKRHVIYLLNGYVPCKEYKPLVYEGCQRNVNLENVKSTTGFVALDLTFRTSISYNPFPVIEKKPVTIVTRLYAVGRLPSLENDVIGVQEETHER